LLKGEILFFCKSEFFKEVFKNHKRIFLIVEIKTIVRSYRKNDKISINYYFVEKIEKQKWNPK